MRQISLLVIFILAALAIKFYIQPHTMDIADKIAAENKGRTLMIEAYEDE